MFASWTKARGASLVAAAAATLGVLASPPAQALEGIQGRHAIFYPSLELVYQHDDNFSLVPDTPQYNKISADTFIAHAHFRLEVPGARQNFNLEYEPQWRNVNLSRGNYHSQDDTSHFWTLNAHLRGTSIFNVDIHQNAALGVLESYRMDIPNNTVGGAGGVPGGEFIQNAGEPFFSHNLDVDFRFDGSRQGDTIRVGKTDTSFDHASLAPAWYELDEWRIATEYHYNFTPMSKFLVGFLYADANQDYTPALQAITLIPKMKSNREHAWIGFDGELGRTTTGRAQIGFINLNYTSNQFSVNDFTGMSARADVTKSFSRWTKLIFGLGREPSYSAYATSPADFNTYYVSNRASFTLTNQPQGARVGWTVIGQYNRNGYDVPTVSADSTQAGLPAWERRDDITRLRAEVGFHPLEHLSFRLNYQYEQRNSNHNEFDFVENMVIFQVQFGF